MLRILDSYWFGQAVVLLLCLGIVLGSGLITPSDEMLTFFGKEIPVMCGFRKVFGIPCPGCGLTRSFTYMAHLDPIAAFQMNWFGPPLFLATFSQIPYRIYTLYMGPSHRRRRTRKANA